MTKLRTSLTTFAAATALIALTLIPGATSAQASDSGNAATVMAGLNNFRASNSVLTPFKANGFIQIYAQDLAVKYSQCGTSCIPGAKTSEVPPEGSIGTPFVFAEKASGSGRPSAIVTEYEHDWGDELLSHNYASVGYVTKGSTDYAILVVAAYTTAPLDYMASGTVSITGTAQVGHTLTGHTGTFSPTPTQFTYHWTSNGAAVGSLNSSTYLVRDSDVGHTIHLVVTGIKAGYVSASDGSDNTAAVKLGALIHPSKQVLFGFPNLGQQLDAALSGWQSGTSLTAQWYRNNKKISGQVFGNYNILPSDKGKKISVHITGTLSGYKSVTVKSAAEKIGPTRLTAPLSVGFHGVGTYTHTLTADPGSWGPGTVHFTYQWLANGKKISGATHKTYKLAASTTGKNVGVKITGKRSGWGTVSVTSPTEIVQPLEFGGSANVTFSIPATLKTGSLLTANHGTWTPTPTKYKYFWYRNGIQITGATSKTYKLKLSDDNAIFKVMVEVERAGYDSTAGTSTAAIVSW